MGKIIANHDFEGSKSVDCLISEQWFFRMEQKKLLKNILRSSFIGN
jgi:hypothetical protein